MEFISEWYIPQSNSWNSKLRYRRKAVEVVATQFTKTQTHPAIYHLITADKMPDFRFSVIMTDFGEVKIECGDWVVEINGKVKVLKDEYFKEHYEVIAEKTTRPKLIIVTDCE